MLRWGYGTSYPILYCGALLCFWSCRNCFGLPSSHLNSSPPPGALSDMAPCLSLSPSPCMGTPYKELRIDGGLRLRGGPVRSTPWSALTMPAEVDRKNELAHLFTSAAISINVLCMH